MLVWKRREIGLNVKFFVNSLLSIQDETDREISLERNLFTGERLKAATSGVNVLSF